MHEAEGQYAQPDDGGEQSVGAMRELIPEHVAERQVLRNEHTADAGSTE